MQAIAFLYACWTVVVELAPWLLLGAALSGAMHVLVPQRVLRTQLRGQAGVWKAVAVGVPLPLCSCGVIPVGLGLKRSGASSGAVVAFLISTPQTGVDSILVSAAMLGWPLALFKVAAAIVMGGLGGSLAETASPPPGLSLDVLNDSPRQPRGWRAAFDHALEILQSIWAWLLLGIVVSALLTTLVPPNALTKVAEKGPLLTMGAALLVSAPLYVCATASAPIAAALVASGLPTGAALVFLMAGPATNAATIGAVYRALGGWLLAIYLTVIVIGSVSLGMLFDRLFPLQTTHGGHHEHVPGVVGVLGGTILLTLMAWFAWQAVSRQIAKSRAQRVDVEGLTELAVDVDGMTCGNCTARLQRVLTSLPGVEAAQVTLQPGRAVVRGDVSPTTVRAAIEEA
ncbi:MAG: permease, partial [Planctomycetales bacterium]|nr:permease [Planctomycetales bacterium]